MMDLFAYPELNNFIFYYRHNIIITIFIFVIMIGSNEFLYTNKYLKFTASLLLRVNKS